MERVANYLGIPKEYLAWLELRAPGMGALGSLRWSQSGEAVEFSDGRTFAFSAQIGSFLEGFATCGRVVHFAHILHLMHLFQSEAYSASDDLSVLHYAFIKTEKRLRNAGVLAGRLCEEVPEVDEPIDREAIVAQLNSAALMGDLCLRWSLRRRRGPIVRPPLGSEAFESKIRTKLKELRREDLEHWLRYGRPPLEKAAKKIAEEILAAKPPSLGHVLAALSQRQRFAGAVPFVAQMVSALSLPPRRLAEPELPLGGYADLATRGQPEQILPSQFALEGTEFLRRFAEKELLYFHREEPQTQNREELVLLLDQGVRTWGDVRLVLGAAVLAFGRMAERRKIPFKVGATSSGGSLIDPIAAGDLAVGETLERSDVSANPGLALEKVLEQPVAIDRDVVLLTHPRNLTEEDVASAAGDA